MSRYPAPPARSALSKTPSGLLELDRFSEKSLQQWQTASRDLDEFQDSLHFGPEPERRRYRVELIASLKSVGGVELNLHNWSRLVTYQFSMNPLSAAGSLHDIGGRFNAGIDLDPQTLDPRPALYLAEDYETAFREKFQIASDAIESGLTPQELALEAGSSHSCLQLQGQLLNVFDMTTPKSLEPLAKVFRRIKMPARARQLKRKLNIQDKACFMVQSAKQIHDMLFKQNWRMLPRQFGLPAQSQTIAELVYAAGYEAILYQSSKGPQRCVAIFPRQLQETSFVALADATPDGVPKRLDASNFTEFEGWDSVPIQFRR